MKTIVIALASSMVLFACSASSESSDGSESTSTSTEALSCPSPDVLEAHNPWWKSQYDGSRCEDTNCGPTAIAMLRNALTCGASNHTGGYMRSKLDYRTSANACEGTDPSEWAKLLNQNEHGKWIDGTEALEVVEHFRDGFTIDDLADKISHGWKAIIPGNANNGQLAPCGYPKDHALFVGSYDSVHEHFGVYDPDSHNDPGGDVIANCGSTRTGHATAMWTKADLRLWASGFFTTRYHEDRSDLWLVIARRRPTLSAETAR